MNKENAFKIKANIKISVPSCSTIIENMKYNTGTKSFVLLPQANLYQLDHSNMKQTFKEIHQPTAAQWLSWWLCCLTEKGFLDLNPAKCVFAWSLHVLPLNACPKTYKKTGLRG